MFYITVKQGSLVGVITKAFVHKLVKIYLKKIKTRQKINKEKILEKQLTLTQQIF